MDTQVTKTVVPEHLLLNDKGNPKTVGLFKELDNTGEQTHVFTTGPNDINGLLSFRRVYVDIGDITEYDTAIRIVGTWDHWQRLVKHKLIKPLIEECRVELATKLRSKALASIVRESVTAEKDATRLAASKFLFQEGYTSKIESSKRGRPSKEEVARVLAEEAKASDTLSNDLKRALGEEVPLGLPN